MRNSALQSRIVLIVCGAASVLSFAPMYWYPLIWFTLGVLFRYLLQSHSPRQAAGFGFWFGLGFFGAGVSWVFVSLHTFGGMPVWMAVPFTAAFCAFLALFHAGFAYIAKRLPQPALALPMIWVLGEWIRSWIFTGFPWLNIGYAHIPLSPLAGLSPIFGIYGVSLCSAFISVGLAYYWRHREHTRLRRSLLATFVGVWLITSALKHLEWTQPKGQSLSVALLQGNIAQDHKWQPELAKSILERYLTMAQESQAQLIILPESAMPILWEDMPPNYLEAFREIAKTRKGHVLMGAIEAPDDTHYFNSMMSLGTPQVQTYRKVHLVPFGEFIPLKGLIGFIYRDWLNMPLSDIARGKPYQVPMQLGSRSVAINICYEDAFGEEIIRALPRAELLVNASNMAWFGDSWAADQHLQMSQARAMETGRMMLRATNTGATAVIRPDGEIIAKLAYFKTGLLEADAQAYVGTTPYVRWGNGPVLICLGLYLGGCLVSRLLRRFRNRLIQGRQEQ